MKINDAVKVVSDWALEVKLQLALSCKLRSTCSVMQSERDCGRCDHFIYSMFGYNFNDLLAWEVRLYQAIENSGLWSSFLREQASSLGNKFVKTGDTFNLENRDTIWEIVKATPGQKTIALAMAIEKDEGE